MHAQADGVFWVGFASGAYRYAPAAWRDPIGITNQSNTSWICEGEDGTIFLSKPDFTVQFLQDQHWKGISIEPYFVELVCPAPGGNVYLRTGNERKTVAQPEIEMLGLVRTDSQILEIIPHPKNRIVEFIETREGETLWVLTAEPEQEDDPNSLLQWYLETYDGNEFQEIQALGNQQKLVSVRDMLVRDNGDVWVAGWGGEGLIAYIDGQYTTFENDLEDNVWLAMIEQDNGTIWVGGRRTIQAWDGKEWKTIKGGFANIRSMIKSSDGSVWAATQNGLFRFYKDSWVKITTEDGLPSNVVHQVIEDKRNRIWAGTEKGVVIHDWEADTLPPIVLPLEDNPVNSKQIPPNGDAVLSFPGMDAWKFTEADRLLFSHKMNDGEWSEYKTETVASFPGLPAGHHTFQVKAMDRNWNESEPVSWEFEVVLPWYQQPAFLVVSSLGTLIILTLGSLHLYHHFNLGRLVAERTKHLQIMAAELSSAEDRERRKLAVDLHDRIGQALAMCQIKMSRLFGNKNLDDVTHQLKELDEDIQQTLEDTRTLTFEISPYALFDLGLDAAIDWLAKEFHQKHGLEINVHYSITSEIESNELKTFVFRMIRELLINIVKHAQAQKADITLNEESSEMHIVVEDDGVGMKENDDQDRKRKSFGLFSIAERLDVLGGSMRIETRSNQGTRIFLQVPIQLLERETA